MLKTLLLTALLATATAAFGQESGLPDEIDLEHARALHEQARDLRSRAEADFSVAEPACYQRFLVNRCLDAARKLRLDRIREARALEIRARRIELADRQRQAAETGMPTQAERDRERYDERIRKREESLAK